MTKRLRWIVTALVGLVALAGAASFAPDAVPAAPPPVRLEGDVVVTDPSQSELVVVPSPSVDLDDRGEDTTTTTGSQGDSGASDASSDSAASPDQSSDDSAGSADGSADSPDDE